MRCITFGGPHLIQPMGRVHLFKSLTENVPIASVSHHVPGLVRIKANNSIGDGLSVGTEILFIDDSRVADLKGLHARLGIVHRPGNQGETGDHVAVDDIVITAPSDLIALPRQDPEVITEIALCLGFAERGLVDKRACGTFAFAQLNGPVEPVGPVRDWPAKA